MAVAVAMGSDVLVGAPVEVDRTVEVEVAVAVTATTDVVTVAVAVGRGAGQPPNALTTAPRISSMVIFPSPFESPARHPSTLNPVSATFTMVNRSAIETEPAP